MTDTTDKLRAVLLTALMIGSVITAGIAFTGAAAAANNPSLTASPDTSGATDVTITTEADVSGNTDTDYVNVSSTAFDFSNVENGDVTVSLGSETRDSGTGGFNVDASADNLDITLGSTITSSMYSDGDTATITISGVTNPTTTTSTSASVNVELETTSPGTNWDTWSASTTINPTGDRGNAGSWSTSSGEGSVGSGATVYQGEDDITFVRPTGDTVNPGRLERTAGASEGEVLQMPIPEDAATGTYAVSGTSSNFNVTVQTPRVSMLEVWNGEGADVSGGLLTTGEDATVEAEYNFPDAENLELTVEDADGLDVTNEILASGQSATVSNTGDVSFDINPSNVDAGDYTFTVEGTDDLDYGQATQTVSVTISSSQTASLNLASDQVTQGENLQYTIENSPEGNIHVVAIEEGDFRDNVNISDVEADRIFRNVGDTLHTNTTSNLAYAVVEIDDGNGVGSIETQYLDDASIDIDLYPANNSDTNYIYGSNNTVNETALNDLTTDDDESFDVAEGTVSLDSPQGTYVVGSEVDINGTANEGTDEVAIYARDNNDYEIVRVDGQETIDVDSDNTFEEEDVVISGNSAGNDLLSLPGTYRVGVIDAQDANVSSNGNVDDTLSTSDFNGGVSSTVSLTVTDTELNGSFETYNGQIASSDNSVDVSGTAPGKNNIVAAFVDNRGNVNAEVVSVDSDGTFEQEDLSLEGMNEGSTVTAHLISSGRDDTFGENYSSSPGNFVSKIEAYGEDSSTGEQVRERILSNSVDDTASDDLIVTEEFRFVDGLTTISSVSGVETGGTLTVTGTTNLAPDDNTITVELLDENGDSVQTTGTDSWNTSGQWTVQMDLSGVEPGQYTVESDDGDNTDRQDIEIVEAAQQTTTQPTTTQPTTTQPTTAEPTTAEPTTAEPTTAEPTTAEPTEGSGSSGSGIPGFGMGIALIAVLGAALLALRQN